MSQAPLRRFPPVPGAYGWVGMALLLVAFGFEVVGIFGLIVAAVNDDLAHAVPWLIVFLGSIPVFGAAAWLLRRGSKRAGIVPQNPLTNDRRTKLVGAAALSSLGSLLGIGGFLYLTFVFHGSRRLPFAFAALVFGLVISEFASAKMYEALGRHRPRFLGWSPKRSWTIAFLLVDVGLVLLGLLWPNVLPTS